MSEKTKDLFWLCLINIFAIVLSFILKANFLTSTLLFLGIPSLYLLYRERRYFNKILLATITFGLFFGFVFDFIAELNKAWSWNGGLLFGKILDVVQIDVMIWFFLYVFHILLFYEHFIDRSKFKSVFSRRGTVVFGISLLSVAATLILYKIFPGSLYFPKTYLILCSLLCLPFLIFLYIKPKLVWHTVPIMAYFFFVYITHEITALRLGQWTFPGDYIGWVNMFRVSFPIEELFFWIILSSLIGSTFYEFSFDNRKN